MEEIYSHLKMFHFADRIATLSQGRIPYPVHVRIKPTNVCNHNCWFCAYRNDNLELGDTMTIRDYIPLGKMRELVSDLSRAGVKAATLSGGGEPLVYPHISELLEGLFQAGIKIGILSNGSLLSGKLAEQISRQATWLRISMDGWDEESYARSRSTKSGEFTKIFKNMSSFLDLKGNCFLSVSYIVDKNSASHVFEVCEQLKQVGVRVVKVSPVIVDTDRDTQNIYHDAIRDIVESEIRKVQEHLVDSRFKVANHYHRENQTFQKPYHRCSFSKLLTVVGADQNLYFCQDKAYTDGGYLGSMKNQSFIEAWNSDEVQKRLNGIDPSRDCRHHCVAHQKNLLLEEYLSSDFNHIEFV